MLHPTRNIVADWRPDDAAKLARMEMEAEVGWPGGGSWQTTPEEAERWIRESDHIGAFVTEEAQRIISICTLTAKPGQQQSAFIPHLNCHPDFHGQKHGKSTLWAAVEYAYRAGYRRVDLGTWAGNLKAVPLYKKMGFMWRPDSSVHMENFTPSARRHPLGRAYFARHDWYETLVRELELKEDLMLRGKVRIYEYLWRAENGDFLRLVFDRQSWNLIEVENNKLLAACDLPDEKLVAGVDHPARWRLVNKDCRPVRFFLGAGGDPGLQIQRREMLEIEAETEAKVEATLRIDPDIPEKKKDPRAAVLRTELMVGDVDLELAAGIEVRQAVSISLDAAHCVVAPGAGQQVVLRLRSNLDESATARLTIAPLVNASVPRRQHKVDLAPWGGAEVVVPLTATAAGPVSLEVEATAVVGRRTMSIKNKRLDLMAVEPGGAVAGVGEEHALLCGGGLLAVVSRRHGDISLYHRLRGQGAQRLQLHKPQVGPPFSWEDLFQEKAEVEVVGGAEAVSLRLHSRSALQPGVALERLISLGQGPFVKVVDSIANGTARPLQLSRTMGCHLMLGPDGEQVVPRQDGVYRDAAGAGGRGLGGLKLPEEEEHWPEGWFCAQRADGCVAGLLWHRAERVDAGGWGSIRQGAGTIKAGQSHTLEPVYALVGDGNWQTVRGWWQSLVGEGAPRIEPFAPATRRPLEVKLEPAPLLIADGKGRATLSLRHVGHYKLDGEIAVETPADIKSSAATLQVKELCADKPVGRRLQFKAGKKAESGTGRIDLSFATQEAVYRSSASTLTLPANSAPVEVARREDGTIAVDNGLLRAVIAPAHMGSVVCLEKEGLEFLNSSYPEAGIRGWRNPWYGGIHPVYDRLWGSLHKERFRHRLVSRRGRQGLVWRGVRVHCTIAQEQARGQSIAFDYLLAPGADVLAVVATCRDELGIASGADLGFNIWLAGAQAPGTVTFHNPAVESITPLAPPHEAGAGHWNWGGLVSAEDQALFLSAQGEGAHARGWSEGEDGCVLCGYIECPLPAGQESAGLFFLVPARGLEEAQARAVWSEFEELP